MSLRLLSPLLLLLIPQLLPAQVNIKSISAAYYGNNLWNEGLKIAAFHPRDIISKTTKKGKDYSLERSITGDISFYNDTRSHQGLMLTAGWHRQRNTSSRMILYSSIRPFGIYRSFLPSTFEVDDAGQVRERKLAGRFYFAPTAGIGLGRKLKKQPNNYIYCGMDLAVLMPYNTYVMPVLNIEMGYRFTLNKKS